MIRHKTWHRFVASKSVVLNHTFAILPLLLPQPTQHLRCRHPLLSAFGAQHVARRWTCWRCLPWNSLASIGNFPNIRCLDPEIGAVRLSYVSKILLKNIMRYYKLIINATYGKWFWPFLSSCIQTWPVTIMNHPKNALKEAQRQSATSHHPGVRKVEKGQFKEPIGYTTQLKSLFHIHSYPSLKNLPLRFDLTKSKTIHQNIYQNDSNDPQHLMISLPKLSPSRCSGSMTEPPSLYAWYLGALVQRHGVSTSRIPGFAAGRLETSQGHLSLGEQTPTSLNNFHSKHRAFENLVMNMGTLAWGPP